MKSKKRERTAARIIQALHNCRGLLTLAARSAGVSYMTMTRYVQDFPSVKEAVRQAKDEMLDFTEGKLFEKIANGDTVAVLFYLKTQGRGRGYIERQEIAIDLKTEVKKVAEEMGLPIEEVLKEAEEILGHRR